MPNDSFIYDALSEFSGGMDSGREPLLLQPNQTAFAINASFRDGYITDRPPYFLRPFNFGGSAGVQIAVEKGLWQGGCYYKPDSGTESLMAAIGGRLFQFTPDANNNFSVFERTIPGDPNPPDVVQAWLWQAENYIIWQDGQSFAVFFDGTSSRRSLSAPQVLGVTSINFVVPAVGDTVNITLVAPFLGSLGQSVLINGATYQVVQPPNTSQATLFNITDTPATVYPVGTPVYVDPNVLAIRFTPVTIPAGTYPAGTLGSIIDLPAHSTPLFSSVTTPGQLVSYGGLNYEVTTNVGGTGRYGIKTTQAYTFASPLTIPTNTPIFTRPAGAPLTQVATIGTPFTAPAQNANGTANIATNYTGAAGQLVTIGTAYYTITAIPPAPPGLNLTIRNINDTPADTVTAPANLLSVPEIGPGRMGAYGMGRNWYSLTDGRRFRATDIVGGPSGSIQYNFRDAVLKESENEFMAGGGDFVVPGSVGNITSLTFAATLDSSLGQGALQVGTPTTMFSVNAPVERAQWEVITNPILTQSLKGLGPLGQNSTINVNSDILFRSNFGLGSLRLGRLEFQTWGNVPMSEEMKRVLEKDDRKLMAFSSSIEFDNRFLTTASPVQGPQGVYWRSIVALNEDPISSLRGKLPSIYDGQWTGLNVLQLIAGKFNGTDRAFAFVWNSALEVIELYELLPAGNEHFDNGTVPILWGFESPVIFNENGKPGRTFKFLEDGEISVKNIVGRVDFRTQYRTDSDPCWHDWHQWSVCAEKNNPTSTDTPNPDLQEQYRPRMSFGRPDNACDESVDKQLRAGYWYQTRILIQGHCRVLSQRYMASMQSEPKFLKPICGDEDVQTGECPECRVLSCVLPDDTAEYTITAGTVYQNTATLVTVTAAPGTYLVPAGVIKLYVSTEPQSPLRLQGCECELVQSIEGKTPAEIAAIAQSMVDTAVQQYARCKTAVPLGFFNDIQCVTLCPEGLLVNVNSPQNLPAGIFVQSGQLCVASGMFPSEISNADANTKAVAFITTLLQSLLDSDQALCGYWNAEQIITCPDDSTIVIAAYTYFSTVSQADADAQAVAAGEAECPNEPASCNDLNTDQYQISPYSDGDVLNTLGSVLGGGEVLFTGLIVKKSDEIALPCLWMARNITDPMFEMTGLQFCNVQTGFFTDRWIMTFLDGNTLFPATWAGEKLTGSTPAGIYTRTGGSSAVPATLTVINIGGVAPEEFLPLCGSS